jgi:hypothetical protein
MSIDLTLMDVGQEKSCIKIIKKPNFVYADFDLQVSKCLLYIADTQQCWKNGEFDGAKLVINMQIPRSVSAKQANNKLVTCSLSGQGHSGIYHAQIKRFFAIQLKGPFHIQDPAGLESVIRGGAGDWLVSDGNINKVITDDMMRRNFALDKAYNYEIENVKPRWKRDKYGLPEHDFTCFTPGL